MPLPSQPARQRLTSVTVSFALHIAFIALALVAVDFHRRTGVKPVPPERLALLQVAGGSHAIPVPLPRADFAAHTPRPTTDPSTSRKTILPVPPVEKNGGGAPPAPHHGDGSGTALRGNGADAHDVRPAFPIFSPEPPIRDRALLPSGEVKVIVNVDVDALGNVTRETLAQGVSDPLDRIVLAIVPTWRFQPATVDGKPVASTSVLVFPFTPSYPITAS